MAVFRIEKTRDYTVMSNYHLRDMSLSLKAKGLLSLMLSLPENWDYTMKGLARICKDGIDSISGGIRELEAHGYIRMKQKEEIAVQQEMLNQQRDKVNANHLELARQSKHVRANEKVIQSQKEKIEQQEKEFKENFISNSDRILSQGELIEEQREELKQLTLRIEDVETLLDEVSSEAYDKAVDKVAEETMRATRKDDIRLAEDSKRWIQSPERKASRKEKEYAINRLDGLIKKIEYAMEKAVVRVVRQLKQPEKKKAVVEEIKKEVKPSIREKLALNVAKIQREEAERKQLNKGRSHSSDLEL